MNLPAHRQGVNTENLEEDKNYSSCESMAYMKYACIVFINQKRILYVCMENKWMERETLNWKIIIIQRTLCGSD